MKKSILLLVGMALCAAVAHGADAVDQAIASLNSKVKTEADKKAVMNAVNQQTQVPVKALESDMKRLNLGYGELLTVESLAMANGKTAANVAGMKRGKSWSDVSKELKIDPASIASRLSQTEASLKGGGVAKGQKSKAVQSNDAQSRQSSTSY